jgi:NADH-quinone oxidoreductase subunit N
MNIPTLTFQDFQPVLPAVILGLGGILLLLTEVYQSAAQANRGYQAMLSLVFTVAAGFVAASTALDPAREVFLGFGVSDPFSGAVTVVVCVGLALSVLLSAGFLRHRNAERGEYYALLLFAGAGMSLLAMSNEFITLFINLEVLSVATYALAAWLRRGTRPSEAGFKYFILGAFAAAILVYGASLLYGATGTTKLSELGARLPGALAANPGLTYLGAALVAVGFAFKVAAVPFHMWTPDVYEGAPTPVSALMSAGVKAAAFAAFVRAMLPFAADFGERHAQLMTTGFAALALLTMVVGNLMALPQRNVKRMLAYSSIAHAGYLMLGVAALFARPTGGTSVVSATPLLVGAEGASRQATLQAILFYLLAYTVTSLGSFGALAALERREDEPRGTAWDLERFSGLAQRKPGWALAMAAMLLSLGGIPPTVGFMGKLFIFRAAVDAGLVWLAVVGVLASAAGVYYYLRVVVHMYMRPAEEAAASLPERQWTTELALALSTVAVVLWGVAPGNVSSWLGKASVLFGQ